MPDSVWRSVVAMQRKYAREVRAAVLALVSLVLATPAAGATRPAGRVVFLDRGTLRVADLATGSSLVVARHVTGAVGLSGDGRFASVGGRIVGGPTFRSARLVWAPSGETAAYQTRAGAVFTWSPAGRRLAVAASWGATSFAWGRDGVLALGRSVCHVPCGVPLHQEVWIRRGGSLRRVAGPLRGVQLPRVTAGAGDGRALWWSDEQGSASIAADGIPLYANRVHLADSLPYPDYVSVCGSHLAVAAGHDRYAMHGKRIVFDGRDVSRDRSRSWVSPSCLPDGRLVAAASANTTPPRIGHEHRSIWQLLPMRRRLTSPPAGFTDEFPRLLPDGSLLFVRTKSHATTLQLWGVGTVELLRGGKLSVLGTAGRASNYYGHYDW